MARIQLATETQTFLMPCMEGDFIVKRTAVTSRGRVRPTIFLDDVAIAPLLEYLRTPLTVQETLTRWSERIRAGQINGVLSWLWNNSLIVEVD